MSKPLPVHQDLYQAIASSEGGVIAVVHMHGKLPGTYDIVCAKKKPIACRISSVETGKERAGNKKTRIRVQITKK